MTNKLPMETADPQKTEQRIEATYRVFLVLWTAIFISLALLLTLVLLIPGGGSVNATLTYTLSGAGVSLILVSAFVKQRQIQSAIETRNVATLQSAYVISFALCESAALIGMVDHFVTGSRFYLFLFGLAFCAMLFHFPRNDHLNAAFQTGH